MRGMRTEWDLHTVDALRRTNNPSKRLTNALAGRGYSSSGLLKERRLKLYSQRDFINEICAEENIELNGYSMDYVLKLTKCGTTRNIFGAFWDINTAAADRIACDKTACYELLHSNGIPAIKHILFNNPLTRLMWAKPEGSWAVALKHFETFGREIVLKPNQGTRGNDVFFCDNIPKLEAAAHTIFANYSAAAISPFVRIQTEYRVFYLNGKCHLVYGKEARETWQHNLAMGAKAVEFVVKTKNDKQLLNELKNLASFAAERIGINFATVDIVKTDENELLVLELNSGVQARLLLEQHPHLRSKVKSIYRMAILGMFN